MFDLMNQERRKSGNQESKKKNQIPVRPDFLGSWIPD